MTKKKKKKSLSLRFCSWTLPISSVSFQAKSLHPFLRDLFSVSRTRHAWSYWRVFACVIPSASYVAPNLLYLLNAYSAELNYSLLWQAFPPPWPLLLFLICTLVLSFMGTGTRIDIFQPCGHCWVFQVCWQNKCKTLMASSFRDLNSSAGISLHPLALLIAVLPKIHLTSHSRMSGSRWLTTLS